MNDDRVQQVFIEALEHEPAKRPKYLDKGCAGDAELRAEVEACLSLYETKVRHGFLKPLSKSIASTRENEQHVDPLIGRRIGPFEIEKRIGVGGMSDVYLASRSSDFEQRVAIKFLTHGLASGDMLRSYRNEIRWLAMLSEHPNIAALYDAGTTDDGLPYLVLEFVEGQMIDEYCDEHCFGMRERLELFRKVCDVVQFAHRHTVVHRDLKPSNIMIRPDGAPKLIDFGIAKLVDSEVDAKDGQTITETGRRILTPEYASPEHIQGEPITTATDVYSLGVVLFELLTGRRPYRLTRHSAAETERIVCNKQPPKPSSVVFNGVLPEKDLGESTKASPDEIAARRHSQPRQLARILTGDLDNIVLRALEKEPERRYSSVDDLSADIGRYLRSEPIHARRIGMAGRGWRWLRRNPVVGGLTLTLFAFVLITAIVSPLVAFRFQQQRDARIVSQKRAEAAEDQAKREADTSRKVADLLTAVYTSADNPFVSTSSQMFPRFTDRQVEILARNAEQAIEGLGDQPEIQAELLHTVGLFYLGLARPKDAERLLKQSLAIRKDVLVPGHVDIAVTAFDLARTNVQLGDWDAVLALSEESVAILRDAPGGNHPLLGPALLMLARMHTDDLAPENPEAVDFYREALTVMTRQWGDDRVELEAVVEDWAEMLVKVYTLKYPDFEVVRAQTPLLFEFLATVANYDGDEDRAALLLSVHQFITKFIFYGDEDSTEIGRKALSQAQRMFGEQHKMVAVLTFVLAAAESRAGNVDAAERLLTESLSITQETLGQGHHFVAAIKYFLGGEHLANQQFDLAETLLQDAVAIANRKVRDTHPEFVVWAMRRLANCIDLKGEHHQAQDWHRRANVLLARQLYVGYRVYENRGEAKRGIEFMQMALPLLGLEYEEDDGGLPQTRAFLEMLQLEEAMVAYSKDEGPRLESLIEEIEEHRTDEAIWRKVAHLRHLLSPPLPVEPAKVPIDISASFISDLEFDSASVGHLEPMRDQVPIESGGTCFLQVDGEFYPKGLYAPAPAKYVLQLDRKWQRLRTQFGLHDGFPKSVAYDLQMDGTVLYYAVKYQSALDQTPTVVFIIIGDGRELWRSDAISDHKVRDLDIPVGDVDVLELVVEQSKPGRPGEWPVWLSPQLER